MEIKGTGFTIRNWCATDAESAALYLNNKKIWNNLRDGLPHPYTYEDAVAYTGFVLAEPQLNNFAIDIDGKLVGNVGIVPGTDVERISAEMGYWLAEPFWGRGIMSEAVKLVAGYVFGNTGITKIFAKPFEFNTASMRVLEKAGFIREGILRKTAVKNGKVWDMHYYGLVKE